MVVTDPNAETLRWLELSAKKSTTSRFDEQSNQNNDNSNPRVEASTTIYCNGYPTRVAAHPDQVYRWICLQTQLPENPDPGVTLEELSLVLSCKPSVVSSILQELQLSGQIYQNLNGRYVPL